MSSDSRIKSLIYEDLIFSPQPKDYDSNVPWLIQIHIATTNGINYVDSMTNLKEIPRYEIPIPHAKKGQVLLDVGCGWGRWMSSAIDKGYTTVGTDISLEFCKSVLEHLNFIGKRGYVVVADVDDLPFCRNTFDVVWSYSVLQHMHASTLRHALDKIFDITVQNGTVKIQLPNSKGVRNSRVHLQTELKEKDDIDSFCVRYYTISEYQQMFKDRFGNVETDIHSFFGLGVLPEDLKVLKGKSLLKALLSLGATELVRKTGLMKHRGDSYYFTSRKSARGITETNKKACQLHRASEHTQYSNLDVIPILECPLSGGDLVISEDRTKCISQKGKVSYPIVNDIPIIVKTEVSRL